MMITTALSFLSCGYTDKGVSSTVEANEQVGAWGILPTGVLAGVEGPNNDGEGKKVV